LQFPKIPGTGHQFALLQSSFGSQALLSNFAAGEARLDVADAALQIGAEDDALVSHSPVALPVPVGPRCRVPSTRPTKAKTLSIIGVMRAYYSPQSTAQQVMLHRLCAQACGHGAAGGRF
jgi:hypothetical protein